MPRRSPNVSRPIDPRADEALDAALDASFPASDPVAIIEPAAGSFPARSRPGTGRASSRSRKKDFPL